MNQHTLDDESRWCCFHPSHVVVGVCALCLNERLLVLAAKRSHLLQQAYYNSAATLPKIFTLSNLTRTWDIKQHKSEIYDACSSTSQEDSFISIKFEENGAAHWDKTNNSSTKSPRNQSSIVEHEKPRASLRWRRRIGQMFQLVRWKKKKKKKSCSSSKGHVITSSNYWWMKTLTRRKNKGDKIR